MTSELSHKKEKGKSNGICISIHSSCVRYRSVGRGQGQPVELTMHEYTTTALGLLDYLEYCRGLNIIDESIYDARRYYLLTVAFNNVSTLDSDTALKKLSTIYDGWVAQDLDKTETPY